MVNVQWTQGNWEAKLKEPVVRTEYWSARVDMKISITLVAARSTVPPPLRTRNRGTLFGRQSSVKFFTPCLYVYAFRFATAHLVRVSGLQFSSALLNDRQKHTHWVFRVGLLPKKAAKLSSLGTRPSAPWVAVSRCEKNEKKVKHGLYDTWVKNSWQNCLKCFFDWRRGVWWSSAIVRDGLTQQASWVTTLSVVPFHSNPVTSFCRFHPSLNTHSTHYWPRRADFTATACPHPAPGHTMNPLKQR